MAEDVLDELKGTVASCGNLDHHDTIKFFAAEGHDQRLSADSSYVGSFLVVGGRVIFNLRTDTLPGPVAGTATLSLGNQEVPPKPVKAFRAMIPSHGRRSFAPLDIPVEAVIQTSESLYEPGARTKRWTGRLDVRRG